VYLSDQQLIARIAELNIETPEGDGPFDPAGQIQAASIDLRLSDVFWYPRRGATIDLLKEKAIQLQPFRFWTRKQLHRSQHIELKPGEMVLGRVHEKLTIPNDCAGKFMGRSSYARLGLMIHCTGDFANPGYRGHMPLQLVNVGPLTLRIYPYMQICQLMLVKLSKPSLKKYGGNDVASKYMNDDGGPSYWWRDKYIRQLQTALAAMDASEAIQGQVYSRLADVDNEVLDRLGSFFSKHSKIKATTAEDLLSEFSTKEDALRRKHENALTIWLFVTSVPLAFAAGTLLLADAPLWSQIGTSALTLMCLAITMYVYFRPRPRTFLGGEELRALPLPKEELPAKPEV
jgi:deoxycytidine triphosphate deaminase